jgi:hypothetical protein
MRIMLVVPVGKAVMCRFESPTTIFTSLFTVMNFELQILNTCLFRQTVIRDENGRSLSASNDR